MNISKLSSQYPQHLAALFKTHVRVKTGLPKLAAIVSGTVPATRFIEFVCFLPFDQPRETSRVWQVPRF